MPNQIIPRLWQLALSEIGVTIAIGAIALGLLAFIGIADNALGGDTRSFDEYVLTGLRDPADTARPIGPAWLAQGFADITALGGYFVLTLLVTGTAMYLIASRKPNAALLVVGAVGSGTLLSELLKAGFSRPRPDLVGHLVEVQSASFPSGHAMISAVTYLTLGTLLARAHEKRSTKIIVMSYAVVITLLIGVSRVYLGVHWPTDVLAGWALGAAWAALWWLLAWWLQRRGAVEKPS